jgi:Uma2 family endonuclease
LDHAVVRVLDPLAEAAGLVGSGPFNLGVVDDFRVPDHGYHRQESSATWFPTAAVVVEILSPDDETYEKFPFYAAHDVEEIVVVDPVNQSVSVWQRTSTDGYGWLPESRLLGVTAVALARAIRWPGTTT